LVERTPHPVQVQLPRAVETPVLRKQPRDVRRVDLFAVLSPHRVVEEQGHHIGEIFQVQFHDLHLGQQEVGRGQHAFRQVKTAAQIDCVAHPDLVEEDVDLTMVRWIPVAQAS